MDELFTRTFDTDDFPARWYCGVWSDAHGWTHIVSDALIFLAYFTIPALLIYFTKKRKDTPFRPIFYWFAAFILTCGLVHLSEAIIFWYPWYRFAALLKIATAVASWGTLIILIPEIPKMLAWPGLAEVNAKLEAEIARRERSEQQLRLQAEDLARANRDLEEFAYIASHDLKGPLRSISQLASWLNEDAADKLSDESARHLGQLMERAGRMQQLLNDLLAYSRAGRPDGSAESIDLTGLVDDVVALSGMPESFEVEKRLAVTSIVGPKTPLEIVLRNLIGNSIKHHDLEAGRLVITAELANDDESKVVFAIQDDGPGIPAEYFDRVFGLFQTLQPRDQVEGSGMGLTLVKRLVETAGGRVWIEPAQSRGTKVCFTWPLVREAEYAEESAR